MHGHGLSWVLTAVSHSPAQLPPSCLVETVSRVGGRGEGWPAPLPAHHTWWWQHVAPASCGCRLPAGWGGASGCRGQCGWGRVGG